MQTSLRAAQRMLAPGTACDYHSTRVCRQACEPPSAWWPVWASTRTAPHLLQRQQDPCPAPALHRRHHARAVSQAERAKAAAAAEAAAAARAEAARAGARTSAVESEMRALLDALQRQRAAGAARMAKLTTAVRDLQAPYLITGP